MPDPFTALPSCYDETGGIVYFPRMLAKIRLHFAGKLPKEYHDKLGDGFDGRCVRFLQVPYDKIYERAALGGTDEEILAWAFQHGRQPDLEQIEIWGDFMRKRGWHDDGSDTLRQRHKESGLPDGSALTFFDFIELDEGRPARLSPH